MSDHELAAIKVRAEAATPGPWDVEPDDGGADWHGFATKASIRTAGWSDGAGWCKYGFDAADATFIAHARTDVPALLAEVERLRGAANWLLEQVEATDGPDIDAAAEQLRRLVPRRPSCRSDS